MTTAMTTPMATARLQDFATSVTTRGRVTFGDVRRLRRNYLPDGITTREDAAFLLALGDKVVRADKAWAQWLIAALVRYLGSREEPGEPDTLLAASPASTPFGRRIRRIVRRELPKLMAGETENRSQAPADEPQALRLDHPSPAPALQLARAIASSEILTRPRPGTVVRRSRKTARRPVLPVEVWSAGLMQKHQRFQLERPYM